MISGAAFSSVGLNVTIWARKNSHDKALAELSQNYLSKKLPTVTVPYIHYSGRDGIRCNTSIGYFVFTVPWKLHGYTSLIRFSK